MTVPSLLSIVTPCLNREHMIAGAIESVLAQNHSRYEHIVIDGGSTDGTAKILAQYQNLQLVSEPDTGMYAAINKGWRLARGEIVGFLNSDDRYPAGTFSAVVKAFADESVQAVAGRATLFQVDETGRETDIAVIPPPSEDLLVHRMILGIPAFNAWFFRRKKIREMNGFHEEYRIVADREFMIRFALAHPPYAVLDRDTYAYRRHSGSLTINEGDGWETRVVPEHLRMTEQLLRDPKTPQSARRLLTELRTRDTIHLAAYDARHGRFLRVWNDAREGMRFDKAWPGRLIARILRNPFCRRSRMHAEG
jgi:glycosyltransferase involved in cell wall biosynthesis